MSLRLRLLTLTVLGIIAFSAALATLVRLARSGHQQRVERAHQEVQTEVERLRTLDGIQVPMRHNPRFANGPPAMRSGYTDGSFLRGAGPVVQQVAPALIAQTDANGEIAEREIEPNDGVVIVVAVVRTPSGRYAWAAAWVGPQRAAQPYRIGLFALSFATLFLAIASLETLWAFRRGTGILRESLRVLEKDLGATVSKPSLRELSEIGDGIEHLARALGTAQKEHARLQRELAERERLASLGRVAAGVAHEVRNPLASMKLRVDLAERAPGIPDEVARDLAEVSTEIQRLDRLVSDLLAITGKRLGKRVVTDLGELAASRASLLAPWAAEQGVEIAVHGNASCEVDRDAVGRAVDNLLRNAVQASPRDASVATRVESVGDRVRVVVCDRGSGVPEDRVDQLFEPFFTTRAEGTGLGLALSRSIATAHGGTLTYERSDGETRFVLSIPSSVTPREETA